jgi:hypothetical protein
MAQTSKTTRRTTARNVASRGRRTLPNKPSRRTGADSIRRASAKGTPPSTRHLTTKGAASPEGLHLRWLRHIHFGATAALVFTTIAATFISLGASTGAASCTVSSILVNSCRPWLGVAAANYPQVAGDTKSQILYHEQRIGRQVDLVHTYHAVGSNTLSATDVYFANRTDTYLFTNWKPVRYWADANVDNATTNAGVDKMAASIKALGSKQIFMTLNHEPENDTSGGGTCSSYKGNSGTTDQYRAMWRYVEDRFRQDGVTNVVWVMAYMNYAPWDCVVNQLYPGDDLIDWITFDAYGNSADSWNGVVGRFYNLLTGNSNSQHNYTSKPWGIIEWAYHHGNSSQYVTYFNQAKAALDNNTYPKLKAYMVYDSRDQGSDTGLNSRVAYDDGGIYQQAQADAYKAFALDSKINGSSGGVAPPPAPVPDTTPPSVTLTSPADGDSTNGIITVSGNATDNIGVTAVTLRVDNTLLATKTSAPYTFSLDAGTLSAGNHTISLRAFDAANNMAESRTVTITVPAVHGSSGSGSTGGVSGGNSGGNGSNYGDSVYVDGGAIKASGDNSQNDTVIVFGGTPSSNAVDVKGELKIVPAKRGDTVTITVDGKPIAGSSVDTTKLTDGVHTIAITENDQTITQQILVDNPWLTATRNRFKSHPVAYTVDILTSLMLLGAIAWLGRHYGFQILATIRANHMPGYTGYGSGGMYR